MEFNYIARNADGTVNVDECVEAYQEALEHWVKATEHQENVVRDAVDSCLALAATTKKPRVPMQLLLGMVCSKIIKAQDDDAQDQDSYATIQKRVKKFVEDRSGELESSALYNASIGKGGGYTFTKSESERRAQMAAWTAAAAAEADTPSE